LASIRKEGSGLKGLRFGKSRACPEIRDEKDKRATGGYRQMGKKNVQILPGLVLPWKSDTELGKVDERSGLQYGRTSNQHSGYRQSKKSHRRGARLQRLLRLGHE